MTALDQLPPDQRAVLSLVLNQGKSYQEVAQMLRIPEDVVRDRAHGALDALATQSSSPPGRGGASSATPAPTAAQATRDEGISASGEGTRSSRSRPTGSHTGSGLSPRGSRTGGALLLGAILAVIVVAVILLSGGGSKGSTPASSTATSTTPSSTAKSTAAAGTPTVDKRLTLTSAEPGGKASGVGFVLSQGARRAFYVAAQGLPPSSGFFYAVWLYNSTSSSAPLGRAPTVGSSGRMEGGGPLPSNAGSFHQLIITRETSTHPTQPGPIVLSGPFALH